MAGNDEQMKASYIDEHGNKIIYSISKSELDYREWNRRMTWMIAGGVIALLVLSACGVYALWWANEHNILSQVLQAISHCREVGAIMTE